MTVTVQQAKHIKQTEVLSVSSQTEAVTSATEAGTGKGGVPINGHVCSACQLLQAQLPLPHQHLQSLPSGEPHGQLLVPLLPHTTSWTAPRTKVNPMGWTPLSIPLSATHTGSTRTLGFLSWSVWSCTQYIDMSPKKYVSEEMVIISASSRLTPKHGMNDMSAVPNFQSEVATQTIDVIHS